MRVSQSVQKRAVPCRRVRCGAPHAGAPLGLAAEALPPMAVLFDLVDEGLFDLGQALTHAHGNDGGYHRDAA